MYTHLLNGMIGEQGFMTAALDKYASKKLYHWALMRLLQDPFYKTSVTLEASI